ncbi:hypothetical protein AB4455_26185 [Vibrio sp. 10N.261.46.E12]|uniref:hypothetical protein n=1 Tax=unclassified Vibrio TaxID=2614977 RepID=UPI0009781D8D|nr:MULTISPECIES: hypothetical protein [unclassified Vibrio]OMO37690.1 hypothetical protein BH584_21395 [Vibrio sp. 10N.261.45.E1]PMJ36892.1 hypothetical protein BCU27_22730 [Vibrio sp. 10N.286.45.B6]PML93593.1 hypothetical protein BCT66_24315 [Vibrio sp. 10N.261.49.E11]PMM86136.1 hypothetical protein BCT46_08615 [Vibrio sp. 10N.261.46.E8]PMN50179.1 hypothetical protein BCT32_04885 [Vibrio sp. 10N.261.45.E11]
MGKYVKVSVREIDQLNSYRIHLRELNNSLSNFNKLFTLDMKHELSSLHIPLGGDDLDKTIGLTPENSGYIFIDRICNTVFYYNNLKRLSIFGFHEFSPEFSDLGTQENSIETDSFQSMIPYLSHLDIPSLNVRIPSAGLDATQLYVKVLDVKPKRFLTGLDFDFDESISAVFNQWTVFEGTGTMLSLTPLFQHLRSNSLVDHDNLRSWYNDRS